ncbi:endonuclease [Tardiphaga alba]|uniref:Endonuclease n=2 Tax=Tardiphaga alba TaxID=340268 RepID=A0ABX8AG74_9BRAD|nr:endonuclease [Tardiphaga alba]
MTWNVHGTFALNPKFDLPGVIALIRKWSPDVVALQEIDSRGGGINPFLILEEALGGHSVGIKSIATTDGDYGQMLISRWPWAAPPEIHDISYGEHEPRRAVVADVATKGGVFRVIATHLGLSIGERRQQTGKLLTLAHEPAHPSVIIGDFNDWFWVNSVRKSLAQTFPERTRHRTFPSRWPLMRLDRIYGRNVKIIDSFTDPAARAISDHLPVIADIVPTMPLQLTPPAVAPRVAVADPV